MRLLFLSLLIILLATPILAADIGYSFNCGCIVLTLNGRVISPCERHMQLFFQILQAEPKPSPAPSASPASRPAARKGQK